FEETWVNQPLKSLLGKTPIDAAADPVLRKRLRGVVRFVEDCAAAGPIRLYDFNRLRAKLGFDGATPETPSSSGPTVSGGQSDADREAVFRTAQRDGNDEAAAKHARELVTRPASGDRYPAFAYL